ncbi:hypothetical protein KOI40_03790 [Aestuariicella sp. G3-2]|uniref:hypothetical protein n=1 Tax=Pseudomaricurvus albidus TaxID=2842452 RepID=UPI001C0B9428|nr:hypothetical protein [Aestuariicella albida]MBU3068926.1 hypothetical protein [Aestuariicella albida]
MSTIFLLQNQHKHLLNKQGEWVDGREANTLFRTPHRDEALNQMIEVNARDYTLRIKILECSLSDRGLPLLKDEDLPPLGDPSTALEAEAGQLSPEEGDSSATIEAAENQPADTTPDATPVEFEADDEADKTEAASLF